MPDFVDISGSSQGQLSVSAAGAATVTLPPGKYDLWADVDTFVRIAQYRQGANVVNTPNRAQDVTTSTGYQLYAGNVVQFQLREGDQIGAVTASASGTLRYHRTGA